MIIFIVLILISGIILSFFDIWSIKKYKYHEQIKDLKKLRRKAFFYCIYYDDGLCMTFAGDEKWKLYKDEVYELRTQSKAYWFRNRKERLKALSTLINHYKQKS